MVGKSGHGTQETFTMDEALERIRTSPPLRKVKDFLDRTDLSADLKALLYDIAKITVKVGGVVVAVGRRVLAIAMALISKFPNTTLGVIVALILAAIMSTVLAWAPIIAAVLGKLFVLVGSIAGAIEDIRRNAMQDAMDRVQAEFRAFQAIA